MAGRKATKSRREESASALEPQQKRHVLVVEDEHDLQDLLRYNLEREGFHVTAVMRGEEALKIAQDQLPDMILLDLMLPGTDGLEVCRILRNNAMTSNVPIVMLTAKGEEADIVAGLELGADDYVTKPFSPRVLIARLKAVLRRRTATVSTDEEALLRVGELIVDPARFEVKVSGSPVALTQTEFRVVQLLASRPGRVFTRSQIVRNVQGDHVAVTDRSVDVHIVSLRRKLGPAGKAIQTVRGVGYRFEDQ